MYEQLKGNPAFIAFTGTPSTGPTEPAPEQNPEPKPDTASHLAE